MDEAQADSCRKDIRKAIRRPKEAWCGMTYEFRLREVFFELFRVDGLKASDSDEDLLVCK